MKTKLFILMLFIMNVFLVNAQSNDEVTLVVSAEGRTKEEATKLALRNALEETYGTFISSSTEIKNDVLVSDDIVSLSQGNIKKYDIIDGVQKSNGIYAVSIKATVSLNKLADFCESKGMAVSFNGKALNMNLKMMNFNKENEYKSLKNLARQFIEMGKPLFDFTLTVNEPKMKGDGLLVINMEIVPKPNANYDAELKFIHKTLSEISLNKSEVKRYEQLGVEYYGEPGYQIGSKVHYYHFRNKKSRKLYELISEHLGLMEHCFAIQMDNGTQLLAGPQIDLIGLENEYQYPFIKNAKTGEKKWLKYDRIIRNRNLIWGFIVDYVMSTEEVSTISSIEIKPFIKDLYLKYTKVLLDKLKTI